LIGGWANFEAKPLDRLATSWLFGFENQHEGEKKKKDLMYAKERFIVATNLNHVNLV
jgi:hypothetical protein